jgi:hypothetical protein
MCVIYAEAINPCEFKVRILSTCPQTANENNDVNGNRSDVGASQYRGDGSAW